MHVNKKVPGGGKCIGETKLGKGLTEETARKLRRKESSHTGNDS